MNNGFCTDLIALFFNHIWGCDDCFSKVVGVLFLFVLLLFLVLISLNCFLDWFEKKLDRYKYMKEFEKLKKEYDLLLMNKDDNIT